MRKEQFIGQTLKGGYAIEKILGEGSFGITYLAHQKNKTLVAVKIFDETSDPVKLGELVQEAFIIAQLRHPHIVPFHKFDVQQRRLRDEHEKETTEHYPFIVMGYANDGSLRRLKPTRSTTPLPADQVAHILVQAASGVQFAHDAPNPVIHRDLKPENILLHRKAPTDPHFDVLVADFGIAIAAHTEGSLEPQNPSGTLPYMAPEQFLQRAVRESDQYAFGIMAYELLVGRRPFTGEGIDRSDNTAAQIYKWSQIHQNDLPPSFYKTLNQTGNENLMGEVLEFLEEVVMKALAKKPQERYPSVWEFAQTLKEAQVKGAEEEERQRKIFEAATVPQVETTPTLSTIELYNKGQLERAYLDGNVKLEEVLQAFDQVFGIKPGDSEAYFHKGEALFKLGLSAAYYRAESFTEWKYRGFKIRYRTWLDVRRKLDMQSLRDMNSNWALPDDKRESASMKHYLNFLNMFLRNSPNLEEALLAFNQAISINPGYFKAYICKGQTLTILKRYEEALQVFDQVINLNPKYRSAYFGKADVLEVLGRKEEAEKVLEQHRMIIHSNENEL